MGRVQQQDWRPKGIDDLEPEAWRALRHLGSSCVVAGPGAGKTEFLAQRAAYLLETGLCSPASRILAISFKSDAAENLGARVRKRCPPELAHRFTSLTFDAFTKNLVDRFIAAIPADWRPTRPFDIAFPRSPQVNGFLQGARINAGQEWQVEVAGLRADNFEPLQVGAYRLPLARTAPLSGIEFTVLRWWDSMLAVRPRAAITFIALNRLAELLLRSTPHIRRALQLTYPFVFVDEFQDTTYAHYDFLQSAFLGSHVSITAVGDDKQRIMTWAGARVDAFDRFRADFGALRFPLSFNFRSSPELVQIQHVVARALDPSAVPGRSRAMRLVDGDVAQVWNSTTRVSEVDHLSAWLAQDMATRQRAPRDYAILVKQKADDYEAELLEPLRRVGIHLRNESHNLGKTTLQDLLSETFTKISLSIFKLGATRRAPEAWQIASRALLDIRGIADGDEIGGARVERELATFVAFLRANLDGNPPSAERAEAITDMVFAFLNLSAVAQTYSEYAVGDLLPILVEAFKLHMVASCTDAQAWPIALDVFEGLHHIPLMTVHKSKGLEYDTVIFVGLDDQAWWAHRPGNEEGLATFFVALSRAKQRVIFAFCRERGQRQRVAELFQLLAHAGVPEIAIK